MRLQIGKLTRYIKYEIQIILNKTYDKTHLELDSDYQKICDRLAQAFSEYEPCERDYIRNLFTRHDLPVPPASKLNRLAAQWATEFIFMIELINQGKMAPNTLEPHIKVDEIGSYHERMQRFLGWLFSDNLKQQSRPVPFFYELAAERLYSLLKDPALSMQQKLMLTGNTTSPVRPVSTFVPVPSLQGNKMPKVTRPSGKFAAA